MEDVGHRREVTAGGVHAILGNVLAIAPSLAEGELVQTSSSFRPQPESGAPLVRASLLPSLLLAKGRHGTGIRLAKATADAVASAVLA